MKPNDPRPVGRHIRGVITNPRSKKVTAEDGEEIKPALAKNFARRKNPIPIVPFISDEIVYLTADDEDRYVIAQANAPLNECNEFVRSQASGRHHGDFQFFRPDQIDFIDVAPRQIVGVSAALIPFLEHDDANRALMGSNMQT